MGLGAAAVLLAGCAHGAAADASRTDASGKPTAAASTAPPLVTQDARACAGAEAVLGHMSADTARWSPERDPFDKTISGRIRLLADALDKQATLAQSEQVKLVVHGNARAFTAVADAMLTKKRDLVSSTIGSTRVAYKQLKSTCKFD